MSNAKAGDKPRIGWIGTGLMGAPMVANLLRAGFPVTVWNRTREKAQALINQGAAWADSPHEIAGRVDVFMTSLTDGRAVDDVLLKQAAAGVLPQGALMIDLSSIAPAIAREHGALLSAFGISYVDAPVSVSAPHRAAHTIFSTSSAMELAPYPLPINYLSPQGS